MDIIRNEKELQQALGGNQAKIGMEGRVVAKIEPLVCANSAAWCIAMVAIATAFFDSIGATKMEAASPQRIMATEDAAGAVDILGAEATYAAISMAVAAGGVEVLEHLRAYRLEKHGNNRAILIKRS
ncbi:hypothetical protein [Helicobacter ailurogastricus]|uniref:Uncharacterized protein n=1 Tax=Helicobacter ailurogastricus TaxID=1578720 RepID=A0A0K2XGU1_9HELI|nr:hypothetical protein [Helicobacter ailurogastricus]CRF41016.1 hypothetical protein HAL011_07920 [Helicobacter ailurogastricus]CRF42304.1 hypothetical protein HAL013_04730 [Helicobacter ailurogastricus]CRF44798.1 hypothetical protein HAL09_14100 [Helicobacter ailurogastricus]CRF52009.1 hypothetical protein HAL07_01350 [Helicobacter ailurogastricus]BDQ29122.1 hypothetical protein ASB7_09590 [Helicobacter ailurogastricus]